MITEDVIAVISKGIVKTLQKHLSKHVFDPKQIGRCYPGNRDGCTVGVHLYGINELEEKGYAESTGMSVTSIELFYMISVDGSDKFKNKCEAEDKIIGKIAEVLRTSRNIPQEYLDSDLHAPITMNTMEIEERAKVWAMFGEPYKLSLFYVVGPVQLPVYDPTVRIKRRERTRAMMPDNFSRKNIVGIDDNNFYNDNYDDEDY